MYLKGQFNELEESSLLRYATEKLKDIIFKLRSTNLSKTGSSKKGNNVNGGETILKKMMTENLPELQKN